MASTLVEPRTTTVANLVVAREDIRFSNVNPDRVRIEVIVRNLGKARSSPTLMILESAPLGAFVPWQPLISLAVPAIGPGESIGLHAEVAQTHAEPLGEFWRVPPQALLTAIGDDDADRARKPRRSQALRRTALRALAPEFLAALPRALTTSNLLAPDVFELTGHRNEHWVGNVNVHVGARPVERHRAERIRLHPGRTNVAIFFVGGGGPDSYNFELRGSDLAETASLVNRASHRTCPSGSKGVIAQGTWVKARRGLVIMLVMPVPKDCARGEIAVDVTQQSTGKVAPVEFSLDTSAAGPGCFTV